MSLCLIVKLWLGVKFLHTEGYGTNVKPVFIAIAVQFRSFSWIPFSSQSKTWVAVTGLVQFLMYLLCYVDSACTDLGWAQKFINNFMGSFAWDFSLIWSPQNFLTTGDPCSNLQTTKSGLNLSVLSWTFCGYVYCLSLRPKDKLEEEKQSFLEFRYFLSCLFLFHYHIAGGRLGENQNWWVLSYCICSIKKYYF